MVGFDARIRSFGEIKMNTFAIIDIGSNSVRLMLLADGNVLYKTLNTTRLGEGIAKTPYLLPAAIERTANAVAIFYKQAIQEGAEKVYAFATAAVRSAKNAEEFIEKVASLCPLRVEVISGEEEAEIGVLGALGEADGGIVDVGGASTEIMIKEQGALLYKKSVNIGVVRLKDICQREKAALYKTAEEYVEKFGQIPKSEEMYAIGGTATTLAALELGLSEYDSKKITGSVLTKVRLRYWVEKLLACSVEEVEKFPCMPKGRADVLAGGAVLLLTIVEKLGLEKLIVSDRDNLEGYAIKKGLM